VTETIVADSTCLIGLERIGRLDILTSLFVKIIVPPEVSREFSGTFDWLEVVDLGNKTLANLLLLVVDSGEAEAIALASELGLRLIVDDKQARSAARQMGIEVIGTVGLLIIAKKRGMISDLKPVLDELEQNKFFIGKQLRAEALKIAGELS
jgi:uncharacterized protein